MNWSWLGGFTEGDGCIHLAKRFHEHPSQIHVSWYQSAKNLELLFAVSEFLEAEGFSVRSYTNESTMSFKETAPMWTLSVRGVQCRELLDKLLPHLVSDAKREKAERALARLHGYEGRVYTRRAA